MYRIVFSSRTVSPPLHAVSPAANMIAIPIAIIFFIDSLPSVMKTHLSCYACSIQQFYKMYNIRFCYIFPLIFMHFFQFMFLAISHFLLYNRN